MTSGNFNVPEAVRPLRRGRVLLACFLVWTLLAGLALWWLLRGNAGPTMWIVRDPAAAKPGLTQRFHATFKADLGLQRAYPWILLSPYIALVALYFPLERGRLRLSVPVNLVACAAFLIASRAIDQATNQAGGNVVIVTSDRGGDSMGGLGPTNRVRVETLPGRLLRPPPHDPADALLFLSPALRGVPGAEEMPEHQLRNLVRQLPEGRRPPLPARHASKMNLVATLLDLLAYGAVIGLTHSVHFYRRFREREHRALLLESNLANARLSALRAQLQPHFLFNSLNAVAALLRRDPRLAETTLVSLSELLRLALSYGERQEVALVEEVNFVHHYLAIQQTRFGEKLRIEEDVEPEALDCLVPTLVLQPLVENAIRHGIEPADRVGLVRVAAHRQEGKLVLIVADDGIGLSDSAAVTDRPGIGLANLRARLETLYGGSQTLEMLARPEGGVVVRIAIPCRWQRPPETRGLSNRT